MKPEYQIVIAGTKARGYVGELWRHEGATRQRVEMTDGRRALYTDVEAEMAQLKAEYLALDAMEAEVEEFKERVVAKCMEAGR